MKKNLLRNGALAICLLGVLVISFFCSQSMPQTPPAGYPGPSYVFTRSDVSVTPYELDCSETDIREDMLLPVRLISDEGNSESFILERKLTLVAGRSERDESYLASPGFRDFFPEDGADGVERWITRDPERYRLFDTATDSLIFHDLPCVFKACEEMGYRPEYVFSYRGLVYFEGASHDLLPQFYLVSQASDGSRKVCPLFLKNSYLPLISFDVFLDYISELKTALRQ